MHDAQSVATYLDRATAQESVRAYKAQSFALFAPKAGAALLEVGCGTGMDVRALATMVAPGGRVVGVDRSETLLTEARRQTDVAGVTIEFRQGDAHRLEFPDEAFDGCAPIACSSTWPSRRGPWPSWCGSRDGVRPS